MLPEPTIATLIFDGMDAPSSLVATRCARLRRACDRSFISCHDPLRPASPRLRSLLYLLSRPAAPGFPALAIAPYSKDSRTDPSPSKSATKLLPGGASIARVHEPGNT